MTHCGQAAYDSRHACGGFWACVCLYVSLNEQTSEGLVWSVRVYGFSSPSLIKRLRCVVKCQSCFVFLHGQMSPGGCWVIAGFCTRVLHAGCVWTDRSISAEFPGVIMSRIRQSSSSPSTPPPPSSRRPSEAMCFRLLCCRDNYLSHCAVVMDTEGPWWSLREVLAVRPRQRNNRNRIFIPAGKHNKISHGC